MTPYHHGNLRSQVLATAAELVAAEGPDALSLRELARRAGVSHAAPTYHFKDRRGLFTALATQGFDLLTAALRGAEASGRPDAAAGTYVGFAISHPGYYAVMFRLDLVHDTDDTFRAARRRAYDLLTARLDPGGPPLDAAGRTATGEAVWSLVHGIAALALAEALGVPDPVALARVTVLRLTG
ncbi:TetR/AcrR family transcriptional regulator [Streptomyces sp. NPDC005573]|uniref:TetR/AcrR family transcriptional regulator n=1 Tax=unclassified Streptomyces TaxID=2593676 RepID=UPI0033A7AC85